MSFHDFIERAWAYGIKPKSRRKITAQQMYPWAVERQLQADLKSEFTKAGLFYKEQALKGTQSLKDNADDLLAAEFNNDERLRPLAERVAYEVEKFQQACFENFSEVVIGERYIPAVVGPSVTDTWENNFLTLCRSTNDDLKRRVSAIISDAVMNGNNIADTARQIDEAVSSYSYSKALTIARTETGKLNMAISKAQMEEAGIDKYEWSCMMDERSRPSHEKMDGKICIWSNPNVVYNIKTKKTEPRPQSAVHLHPGDDYNCRCVALPWDELIEEELNKKKGKPNKQWLELKEQEKQKAAEKRAERKEIKRNKELVPQLTAENEKLQKRLDKMSQELLEEQLEREGLEETLQSIAPSGVVHEETIYIHTDKGIERVVVEAESRQEAKYKVYLDIKNNPDKYGSNAFIPKFNPSKYEKEIKKSSSTSAAVIKQSTTKKETSAVVKTKSNEAEPIKIEQPVNKNLDTSYASQFTDEEINADLMTYDKQHIKLFKKLEDELGIKRGLSMNHEQANTSNTNPNYGKDHQYSINCQTCVPAYMLRRWGFDIEAMKSSDFDKTGIFWQSRFLKNNGVPVVHTFTDFKDKDSFLKFLDSETKENGIYEIYVGWKSGSAHVYTYIHDGMTRKAYDPQKGADRKIGRDLDNAKLNSLSVIRIDNSLVNTKMCKAFAKSKNTTKRI